MEINTASNLKPKQLKLKVTLHAGAWIKTKRVIKFQAQKKD